MNINNQLNTNYPSNCQKPSFAGTAQISKTAYEKLSKMQNPGFSVLYGDKFVWLDWANKLGKTKAILELLQKAGIDYKFRAEDLKTSDISAEKLQQIFA